MGGDWTSELVTYPPDDVKIGTARLTHRISALLRVQKGSRELAGQSSWEGASGGITKRTGERPALLDHIGHNGQLVKIIFNQAGPGSHRPGVICMNGQIVYCSR
jgi:hypothetical protein